MPSNRKIKLPFDMGFNKIEKFFKNFNVFDCHRLKVVCCRLKLLKIRIFHENGLFSVRMFYDQLVACPVIYYWKELFKLIRMVFNLLKSVHI